LNYWLPAIAHGHGKLAFTSSGKSCLAGALEGCAEVERELAGGLDVAGFHGAGILLVMGKR